MLQRVFACFVLAGCASSTPLPDHTDPGPDAGPSDSSVPDGTAADASTAVPTTITLENAGSAPFVVGGLCGGSFLTLEHAGQPLAFDRGCACACDAPDACGCPPACLNTQELIVPGDSAVVEWDGFYARFDDPGCYELAFPPPGDTVVARACWNPTPDGESLHCQDQSFAYGADRAVTIRAEHHSAARTPQRVVLENQTGGPIEIVTDQCGVQDWFGLGPELEARGNTLSVFCGCACDAEFENAGCPTCGGCAETVFETLQPGATHAFEWDGMFFHAYASGCAARFAMPAGFSVEAEVCFQRAGAELRECQPIRFTLGEQQELTATVH
jgi:hypothetical protein